MSNTDYIMFRELPLTFFKADLLATNSLSRHGEGASVLPGEVQAQGSHTVSTTTMAGKRSYYSLWRIKVLAYSSAFSDIP